MIEIDELKSYLRIDNEDENNLLKSMEIMGTELVEDILRRQLSEFEIIPETIKQAVLITTATLYENRQGGKDGLNSADLIDLIKRLTFAYRKECF